MKTLLNTGANIRYIRQHLLKLTREQLAKKLGLSTKTIYNWENKQIVKQSNYYSVCNLIEDKKEFSIGYKLPAPIREITIKGEISLD
jgi:DNA-binding XRE family transcriptional regulator